MGIGNALNWMGKMDQEKVQMAIIIKVGGLMENWKEKENMYVVMEDIKETFIKTKKMVMELRCFKMEIHIEVIGKMDYFMVMENYKQ